MLNFNETKAFITHLYKRKLKENKLKIIYEF